MVRDDTNLSQADSKDFSSLNIFSQQNWYLNAYTPACRPNGQMSSKGRTIVWGIIISIV